MDSEDVTTSDCHDCNTPPILSMPIEILLRISFYLKTTDLCSFRLTCRGIENSIYNDFADEFFSRKQFMVSEFSLKALCDIANSRLGCRLKQFHLGLEPIVYDYHLHLLPNNVNDRDQRRFQDYYVEQQWLWNSGRVQDLLTAAFRHLPNLETVVIRDFNSRTRYRDGPREEWNSYGSMTMKANLAIHNRAQLGLYTDSIESREYVSRVFTAVLVSLARANARPGSLKIYERHGHRLQDSALHIPPALQESIAPVLGSLKELHLCIHPPSVMLNRKATNISYLSRFLAFVPNLLELRINSDRSSVVENGIYSLKTFQQWLAAPLPAPASDHVAFNPPPFQDEEWWEMPPPAVTFPKLRTLSLGCMPITVRDLLAIITKFAPEITRLELWEIVLHPGPASSDAFAQVCVWQQFFRGLLQIQNLELREIMIGRLRQRGSSNGQEVRVQFVRENAELSFDKQITFDSLIDFHGKRWRDYVTGLSVILTSDVVSLQKKMVRGSVGPDADVKLSRALRKAKKTLIHRVRLED